MSLETLYNGYQHCGLMRLGQTLCVCACLMWLARCPIIIKAVLLAFQVSSYPPEALHLRATEILLGQPAYPVNCMPYSSIPPHTARMRPFTTCECRHPEMQNAGSETMPFLQRRGLEDGAIGIGTKVNEENKRLGLHHERPWRFGWLICRSPFLRLGP